MRKSLHFNSNKPIARFFSGYWLLYWLLLLCVFCHSGFAQTDAEKTKERLAKVQQDILASQNELSRKQTEQNKIQQALKQTDQAIGDASKILRQTEQKLNGVKKQLAQLEQRQSALEKQKKQQLNVLEGQIKSAYQVGQHDYLKMMLNQDSPAKLERVLSYYQYLNQARLDAIAKLKLTLTALATTTEQLNRSRLELADLVQLEKSKQAQLVKLKHQQSENLKQLTHIIKTERQQLLALKQDESALSEALKALAEAVEALPKQLDFAGLAQIKGKLLWPTKGRVKDYFGRQKSGELRWKGIMIDTDSGSLVTNIYAGQVVFSDWLNGYGLVLVIEHGDGYMSLYGHNQALLKDVGDIVHAGEPIALVGQSGGQNNPGLYFEIRHQGQPLDPTQWCH